MNPTIIVRQHDQGTSILDDANSPQESNIETTLFLLIENGSNITKNETIFDL